MRITVEHLLDLIDALPKNKPFDYVIAGGNKAILVAVDKENGTVGIEKLLADSSKKSSGMTRESVHTFAANAYDKVPFSVDSIFNGSGSSRSTWEAILANTAEFYTCKVNNQKHLVWVPDQPHDIGSILSYSGPFNKASDESDENQILEPPIANFITAHDGENISFEDLLKIYLDFLNSPKYQNRVIASNYFGIHYAPHILPYKSKGPGSIAYTALGANKEGSMSDEINRGVGIGIDLRKHLAKSHVAFSSTISGTESKDSYDKYLRALRTKPFLLLAGISGTGKSRIVRELAFKSCPEKLRDKDGTTPGNYLMVEVKPNWHDSSELIGYYSNIAHGYQYTKFIEFAVKATKYPDVPFFVCLDEMNLAPVEQYFAEFLSILETRKNSGSAIHSGALVEAKYIKDYAEWNKDEPLTLPDNLFIIGTVNMDDTTHKFSRKVIDRAMTIEMNGGDLKSMFSNSDSLAYLSDSEIWTLGDFKPKFVSADEVLKGYPVFDKQIREDLPTRLETINDILDGTPFKVSYRVLNELSIYLAVLLEDGYDIGSAINQAVDQIALMKILPRIEGDEETFNIKGDPENRLEKLMAELGEESDSGKKLDEMNRRLSAGGFTRFWP